MVKERKNARHNGLKTFIQKNENDESEYVAVKIFIEDYDSNFIKYKIKHQELCDYLLLPFADLESITINIRDLWFTFITNLDLALQYDLIDSAVFKNKFEEINNVFLGRMVLSVRKKTEADVVKKASKEKFKSLKNKKGREEYLLNLKSDLIFRKEYLKPDTLLRFQQLIEFIELHNSIDFEAENSHKVKSKMEIVPIFKTEIIPTILDLLYGFFPEQKELLKRVLETGICLESKLYFHGNGKTLLDFFKQLMKGQFLSIPVQKDFEKWVSKGFEYHYRGAKKEMTEKYASKIISGNERAAKGNRLIDVQNVNGKFEIFQLAITNRQQAIK